MEEETGGRSVDQGPTEYYEKNCISLVKELIVDIIELKQVLRKSDWNPDGTCLKKTQIFTKNDRNYAIEVLPGYGFKRVGTQKFFTGLIPRLKHNLWPWNDCDPKKKKKKRVSSDVKSKYFDYSKDMRSCYTYGDVHGSTITEELQKCVTAINEETDVNLRTADPCTARILDILKYSKFVPVAAELLVWNNDENVATGLDLLVIDIKRENVVAIEIKTGYETEEYSYVDDDYPLLYPFGWLRDCPEHRHLLQLAATIFLLENGHGEKIDKAYIMRLCSKQRVAMLIELPTWFERKDIRQCIEYVLRRK